MTSPATFHATPSDIRGSTTRCPECGTFLQLSQNGAKLKFRVHGPKSARCAGSGTPVILPPNPTAAYLDETVNPQDAIRAQTAWMNAHRDPRKTRR